MSSSMIKKAQAVGIILASERRTIMVELKFERVLSPECDDKY